MHICTMFALSFCIIIVNIFYLVAYKLNLDVTKLPELDVAIVFYSTLLYPSPVHLFIYGIITDLIQNNRIGTTSLIFLILFVVFNIIRHKFILLRDNNCIVFPLYLGLLLIIKAYLISNFDYLNIDYVSFIQKLIISVLCYLMVMMKVDYTNS